MTNTEKYDLIANIIQQYLNADYGEVDEETILWKIVEITKK